MPLLIDAMLAMSIAAVAIVQADMQAARTAEVNVMTRTGQYMYGLQQAVNEYITVNGIALATHDTLYDPNQNAIAIANPLKPSLTELETNGFLPVGYNESNPAGLKFSVSITPSSSCPYGSGCTIPATIKSNQYLVNGQIRNDLLSYAVMAAGLDAAQSLVSDPTEFKSIGHAPQPNTDNLAGELLMRAGYGTQGFIDTTMFYTLDGKRALLGAMHANKQDIDDVGTLNATTANVTTANMAAANVSGNANVTGAVNAGGLNVGNGAVTADSSGNIIAGNVVAGNVNVPNGTTTTRDANVQQVLAVGGMTYATGGLSVGNSATITGSTTLNGPMTVTGTATVNGATYLNGTTALNGLVQLAALGSAGASCGNTGEITTDSSGGLLTCQGGVWTGNSIVNSVSQWQLPPGTFGMDLGWHPFCFSSGDSAGVNGEGGIQEVYTNSPAGPQSHWFADNISESPRGQGYSEMYWVTCVN